MNHHCCSGGNHLETPLGGSPDFLAKSLANPDKISKRKEKNLFKILSGFASDLAKISGDPPSLWTISAGTTLLVHTVCKTGKELSERTVF